MIPHQALADWNQKTPWALDEQVAQDLFLCTIAIEIAKDPILGRALAWRGGTCLHRLHLPRPYRYSEDLDYVLLANGVDYAQITTSLKAIALGLGATMGRVDKSSIMYRTHLNVEAAGMSQPISVKIEINPSDAGPVLDLLTLPLVVRTLGWYEGEAEPLTYQVSELLGSKIRALSERRKGRDLWDIHVASSLLVVNDVAMADCAAAYLRRKEIMPSDFRLHLADNLNDPAFLRDMDTLIIADVGQYDPIRLGRALIVWADQWLDPRLPAHQQRQSGFPTDGLVRCPVYTWQNGSLTRCMERASVYEKCPIHQQTVETWSASAR